MPKFGSKYSTPQQQNPLTSELNTWTKWGYCLILTAGILISLAILTPYWLQNNYEPTFAKMGLWIRCAANYDDYRPNEQYYGGKESLNLKGECKWNQAPYSFPWAFLVIQLSFLFCWILVLIAVVRVVFAPCLKGDFPIKPMSIILMISAFLGVTAIILFAAMKERWHIRSKDNFISWSFVLAVLGVLAEVGASILILYKSRRQITTETVEDNRIY